jgi:predicted DNA-binding transcriptional regulator YafY
MTETAAKLRRLLESESPQTAKALVGKLRCTKRHLRRLVEELTAAGIPVEKDRDGRERTYAIPNPRWRTRVPVRLSPPAPHRLLELAEADDHPASVEAEHALRAAMKAEP